MNYPGVSCYCSTYGRVHTLEEVLESFLRQDYPGPKELVILNDCVDQELEFRHPEVRIINLSQRIKPLGRKFNTNIDYCKFSIVACWEDDDIYLPNHLSTAVKLMNNGVFHTGNAWYEETSQQFIYTGNYYHATHVFTKELFELAGKYPEIDNCTLDIGLMGRLQNVVGSYTQTLSAEQLTYIYRWGTANCYHGSGWGTQLNISDEAENVVRNQLIDGKIPKGHIRLRPYWKYEYQKIIQFKLAQECTIT